MTFSIFEKNKGTTIHPIYVIGLFLSILSIPRILFPDYFNFLPKLFIYLLLLYLLIVMIWNSNRYEKPNGKFIGSFDLQQEEIRILNRHLKLNEIKNIEFIAGDVKGVKGYYTDVIFSPRKSAGVNNTIKIKLLNGETIEYNFLQQRGQKISDNKALLIEYYTQKKITWLGLNNLISLSATERDEIK